MTKTTTATPQPAPLIDRAWHAIDGLAALEAARDATDERPPSGDLHYNTTTPAESRALDALIETLIAGEPRPSDETLGAAILADEQRERARDAALRVRRAAASRLAEQVKQLRARDADAALAFLHEHLIDSLIPAVRETDSTLGGNVVTAEDALGYGTDIAAAWRRMRELTAEYAELRAAQSAVVVMVAGVTRDSRGAVADRINDNFGELRNVDELWPDWYEVKVQGRQRPGELANAVAPPWPRDEPARLRWLVTHGAQFWVPSVEQLVDAEDEGRARGKAGEPAPRTVNVRDALITEDRARARVGIGAPTPAGLGGAPGVDAW